MACVSHGLGKDGITSGVLWNNYYCDVIYSCGGGNEHRHIFMSYKSKSGYINIICPSVECIHDKVCFSSLDPII